MQRNAWIPGVRVLASWGTPAFIDVHGNEYFKAEAPLIDQDVKNAIDNVMRHCNDDTACFYFVRVKPNTPYFIYKMVDHLFQSIAEHVPEVVPPFRGHSIRAQLEEGATSPPILVLEAEYRPRSTTGYVLLRALADQAVVRRNKEEA